MFLGENLSPGGFIVSRNFDSFVYDSFPLEVRTKLGVIGHSCSSGTQEVVAGRSEVQDAFGFIVQGLLVAHDHETR